jgi:hypothetical protein
VDTTEVAEQIPDPPPGAGRDVGVQAGALRRLGEPDTVAAERGEMLGNLHAVSLPPPCDKGQPPGVGEGPAGGRIIGAGAGKRWSA